jgi:hypothetical protein
MNYRMFELEDVLANSEAQRGKGVIPKSHRVAKLGLVHKLNSLRPRPEHLRASEEVSLG